MTAELEEIIARLEKATGPDRELDAVIWKAVTPGATRRASVVKSSKGLWPDYTIDETREASGRIITVPAYTGSIDAALTLVPEGWRVNWAGECPDRTWFFELIARYENVSTVRFYGATAAIALCIAALKARARTTQPASE